MSSNTNQENDYRIVDNDPDRERGILTPHDRAFLRCSPGEGVREDMSDTAIRQKRHKIRNRFRNALIDIQYLLLLEKEDLTNLFPSEKWHDHERDIVHSAVLAAVYHLIRAESGRETIFDTLKEMVANDVVREYADEHRVYAPVEVEVSVDVPPVEECPSFDGILAAIEEGKGDKIPYKAHMALAYGGVHPNPEEYL